MKKRFITFLLSFIMLTQLIAMPVNAQQDDSALREYEILKAVGIANFDEKSFNISEGITYADFLVLIVNSFGHTYSEYSDVVMGIAKENSLLEAEAEPKLDRFIQYSEAVALAKTALTYETYLGREAIEPVVSYPDLTKGISNSKSKFLSATCAMKLIYNMVLTDLYVIDVFKDNGFKHDVNEGDTILARYRDIHETEGLVEENRYTSLYGASTLKSNEIRIGDQIFVSDKDISDLLGFKVKVLAKKTEDDDKGTVVYAEIYRGKSLNVEAGDFIRWETNMTHFVYSKNGTSKRISVSKTAKFFYNGVICDTFTDDVVKPKDGAIEFIDAEDDGTYEVVKITAYEYMLVENVSASSKTITNAYTYSGALTKIKLDLDDSDNSPVIVMNGQEIGLKDIMYRDVAAVQRTRGASPKVVKVEIFRNSITAIASGFSMEDNEIEIDGNIYHISDTLKKAINANDTKVREVSTSDELSYYIAGNVVVGIWGDLLKTAKYGYMTRIKNNTDDEIVTIRIFDEDGKWGDYKVAEKVRLNNESKKPQDIYNALCPGGVIKRQMLCYTLNSDNLIKKIQLAVETDKKGYDGFSNMGKMTYRWRIEGGSMDSEIFVDENTKVFVIPTNEETARATEYYITNSSSFATDAQYTFTPYNVDEYGFTNMMVMNLTESAETLVMVDKVVTELNTDGEPVMAVYGKVGEYNNFGLQIAESVSDMGDFYNRTATYPVSNIRKGDMLLVAVRGDGMISQIQRIYTLADGKKPRQTQEMYLPVNDFSNFATTNLFNVVNRYTAAVVEKVHPEKKLIVLNYIYDFGSRTKSLSLSSPRVNISIYDCDTKQFKAGSYSDIEPGDYVVSEIYASAARKMVVYKNMQ